MLLVKGFIFGGADYGVTKLTLTVDRDVFRTNIRAEGEFEETSAR